MSTEAVSNPAEPEQMGEFSRLTGAILEPTRAFTDIARRPKWLLPMVLVILSSIALYSTFGSHVGWARFVNHTLETNPKAQQRMEQVPPDQRAKAIEAQIKYTGIGFQASAVVITPLILLLSSAIVLAIANSMAGGIRFKQVFAIEAYAALPLLLRNVLAIVVMFLKNPDDFNIQNPLAFNPAAFMDPITSSKFWYTVGTAADLFNIWVMLLTAVGIKAAAGKRLSFGGALMAAATPWILFTLLGATVAGMFS